MGKMLVRSKQHLKPIKPVPLIFAIALVALIYYGMAEISRHIAATPQSVTPVWPPDGFASAAVLIWGYQILPGVLIGAFLANIWAFFDGNNSYTAIASILVVLGIAIGTTLGTALGSYLLRQSVKGHNLFGRLENAYKFFIFTCLVAPMINATFGNICLSLGGQISWEIFGHNWLIWWLSNVTAIYVLTPTLVIWWEFYIKIASNSQNFIYSLKKEINKISMGKSIELFVVGFGVIYLGFISFWQDYDFEFILIPCLVWSVIRLGSLVSTSLIVVIAIISVGGTIRGLGAFGTEPNLYHSLILLQSFLVVIVVTTISLTAILSEKQEAIANLNESKIRLSNKSIQLQKSKSRLKKFASKLKQKNIDLTEAKKVAEEANRTKTEFLSNMSHELRTPLNGILGFVQLLQDSKHFDSQDQSDLLAIYQSGIHLLNLINDILDISKIEAGKMALQPLDVYFPTFLTDIVGIMQVQATTKNINFIYQHPPDLPQIVHVDAKRLKQILLNLLGNAIKFCEQGQVIFKVSCHQLFTVNAEDVNNRVSINFLIEDTGIGIEADRLETIFLPFEQFGGSKFQVQGTGLGLPISQRIAGMMDSQITVSSQIGLGSIFEFTVNLEVIESKISYKQITPTTIPKSTFDQKLAQKLPLRILLAEDNIVNQRVVCKILDRLGYKIDVVANGLKVLEAIRSQVYDVVLMDVQMPEMNGIEATRHIVNDSSLGYCPYIIALTASAMDSDRHFCLEAGMNDFITKPISVDLLVEALWRSRNINAES